MYWEWTEDHSAAWAEPWTSRAWNSLWTPNQGRGAWRALNNETFFFYFKSISPWWTLVSLILSFSQHLKYVTDIILEALGLFDWCSHDCVCCNELPTSQLDNGNSTGNDRRERPDHLKKKKKKKMSYLYTLMPTLRVRVVFSCLSEEDVSALRHGTVFIFIKTGFMTDNDGRLRGYVKTLFPHWEIIKS